ncbi:phage holin family protein [Algoriphagus sp. NF]|jgi:ABC-type transport system involved in cytochrome bd biosynthesis fused ATPase/permease subunit|uniref:Phage holin family protein n=2 Tax=Algoriphagus TaxID=246875 RepID=A0ABS7N6B2_9BACT|nr:MULTISPECIES: phage holin family protein [Algoriphagus]MBY5951881.1 phage holin family protein [Algoriphagus marincola]MCR9081889.1 phage holin family protein [Cyclobacteriaceae bacterium]MDE0561001.1 phage holin family protein [Algoriphagus sp. NF]TDK44262.1 phage holin family protein [Algoriphagus aquimaris]
MLNISEITQTIKKLVETRINLIKQDIQEEILTLTSRIFLLVVIGGLMLLVLLFLSLALAFFLSSYLESPFSGFLIVGLLFLLMILILYKVRDSKSFKQNIQNGLKNFIGTAAKNFKSDEE